MSQSLCKCFLVLQTFKLYVLLLISHFSKGLDLTMYQTVCFIQRLLWNTCPCLLWESSPLLCSCRAVWPFRDVFQWVTVAFKSLLLQGANCAPSSLTPGIWEDCLGLSALSGVLFDFLVYAVGKM